MTSSTASLLQHLLTRSDLTRLEIASTQVEQWEASGALEAVAVVPSDGPADEHVFVVADETLRSELDARLATIGKPDVLSSPPQIRSFLRSAANGQMADADLAEQLAAVLTHLDGDLENLVRLALEAPDTEPALPHPVPIVDDSEVTDILRGDPNVLPDSNVSAWFRDEQAVDGQGAPLDDLVPLAGEDFEELEATVAFHSEQIERLVDLPHVLEQLAREVAQLRGALESAGLPVPEPVDAGAAAELEPGNAAPVLRSPRTALLVICTALLCWTGLVWAGTGSAALALTSFVAANVVGYLALQPASWRR